MARTVWVGIPFAWSTPPVGRLLFVVARGMPERYEFLRYAFAGHEDVEVIVDRRREQRRLDGLPAAVERRRRERRRHDISADLARQGYAVVRWR